MTLAKNEEQRTVGSVFCACGDGGRSYLKFLSKSQRLLFSIFRNLVFFVAMFADKLLSLLIIYFKCYSYQVGAIQ